MTKQFLIAGLLGATLLGSNPAVATAAERDRPNQRMNSWQGSADRGQARVERMERPTMSPQRAERPRDTPSVRVSPPRGDRGPDRSAQNQERPDRRFPNMQASSPDANARPNGNRPPQWTQNRPDRPDRGQELGQNRPDRPQNWNQNRPGDPRPGAGLTRPDRPQNWNQTRPGNRPDDRGDWRNNRGDRYTWDTRNPRHRTHNWDRDWRRDQRYDWQRYRDRYGNRYRSNYYAPRGWSYGYSRFSIGFSLWSGLYASQYWINDPYYYRLPPAYGSLRWVRYYDDALLVDIRSGQVVDVIYDLFW